MYDVAIVGLGPAGATLARLLGASMRVIAIDLKDENNPEGFRKPCGGLLAPDAQKALSQFQLTLPVDVLVDPQIFSVRTIDLKTRQVRHYQRHYINLDRHKFDLWLESLIPPQVDIVCPAKCMEIKREQDRYAVSYLQEGVPKTVHATYLIGADGAKSVVRSALYPKKQIREYLSIQQWFADTHGAPFYSCVFDPDLTDCYAWGLTKDDSFIFGGAFPKQTAKQNFETMKQKLVPFGFQLETPLKTEACLVLRPSNPFSFCCGKDGAFLIGEAAGFISPSSLEGISYAVQSAVLLAQTLLHAGKNPNRSYHQKTRKLRCKLMLKQLKSPFMYRPFLRKLVMKSGLNSVSMYEE